MKLRDIFEDGFTDPKSNAIYCEKIADDYAIFFAEWCANKYVKLHSVWCPIFGDQRDKNNWRTTKELLEIFKKEKGL